MGWEYALRVEASTAFMIAPLMSVVSLSSWL